MIYSIKLNIILNFNNIIGRIISKDNLARFINILDGIWGARNQAIFGQKDLQIMEVIMSTNKSHIEYQQSQNKDNQRNRSVTENNNHNNYQMNHKQPDKHVSDYNIGEIDKFKEK